MSTTLFKATSLAGLMALFIAGGNDCDPGPPDPTTPTPAPNYDFWVGDEGPTGPLWTGPQQYPFVCYSYESDMGQPLIDNVEGIGSAVFPLVDGAPDYEAEPLGYSANCSVETRVDYFYLSATDGKFRLYEADNPPADMATLDVDGVTRDFLVRVEAGTLNRFLYTIAMLAPYEEDISSPTGLNNDHWNKRLIYYLRGGVGIGHWQGEAAWHGGVWSGERGIFADLLGQGYAIATSSGNETGVHYNMNLADETAHMVKAHFNATYGEPDYTVGIGGSGGGVQQYMFAQNRPGIIDAGIPLYSYPDMITQSIYVGDCNLLEQYFLEDVALKGEESKWATWSNRQWIEGLNASDTVENAFFETPGSSECIEGWGFAEPFVMNPQFTLPEFLSVLRQYRFPQSTISNIRWTHFNDLENVYGTDNRGFAPTTFDNEGVQYGLKALKEGKITVDEFIEINSCAGTWTDQEDYVIWDPFNDPFDSANMVRDADACRNGVPAPRTSGNIEAMNRAYESGHVFIGDTDMPMIDLRPYLEEELDMHNTRQSFSARQRLLNYDGDASNQVIWFTGSEDDIADRIYQALDTLDVYFTTGSHSVDFTDKCFTESGVEIASGDGVWDGILNDNPIGACAETYKIYDSSRIVAGDTLSGDMFKCALKTFDNALTDGTYDGVEMTREQEEALRAIFETGVCDYSRTDLGNPWR